MLSIRTTSILEFNNLQPLLSLLFPSLFPRSEAEFITPRIRTIFYSNYIKHLFKYYDGRFTRYPRFRYVVFNTIIRK